MLRQVVGFTESFIGAESDRQMWGMWGNGRLRYRLFVSIVMIEAQSEYQYYQVFEAKCICGRVIRYHSQWNICDTTQPHARMCMRAAHLACRKALISGKPNRRGMRIGD